MGNTGQRASIAIENVQRTELFSGKAKARRAERKRNQALGESIKKWWPYVAGIGLFFVLAVSGVFGDLFKAPPKPRKKKRKSSSTSTTRKKPTRGGWKNLGNGKWRTPNGKVVSSKQKANIQRLMRLAKKRKRK